MPKPNIRFFSTVSSAIERKLVSAAQGNNTVNRFVEHVTHGQVVEAKNMILHNPLILSERSTTVTDIGGRRFEGLKAGAYAMWNRDTEMLQAMLDALRTLSMDVQHTSYAAEQMRQCLAEQFKTLNRSGLSYVINGAPKEPVLNEKCFDLGPLLDAMKLYASSSTEERSARDYLYPIHVKQRQLPPSGIRLYFSELFSAGVNLNPVLFYPSSPTVAFPGPWGRDLDPNKVLVRCASTTPYETTRPEREWIASDCTHLRLAMQQNQQRFELIINSLARPLQTSDCTERHEQARGFR